MITLVNSHNIAISKEDRYKLYNRQPITVVGVSVPVWFEKGNTSEPACEIFSLYKITNEEKDYQIKQSPTGYEINLPQPNSELEGLLKNLDQEVLASLGIQREIPKSIQLLNYEDGGFGEMFFRNFYKSSLIIDGEKTKIPLSIIHSIEIISLENLVETLD